MTRSRTKGHNNHQKRLERDASVAIIGCGIAGLSAGISLVQAGFTHVAIYERDVDPTTRREGFGMTLTYNPKGPLAHCGILETVAQQDCPSRSHYIFDPTGKVLGYYGNAFSPTRGFGQRGNMRIPRQTLQKIMTERFLDLIQKNNDNGGHSSIYWDSALTSIQEMTEEGKVKMEFRHVQPTTTNGNNATTMSTKVTSDIVIAADGVRSSVINMLAPQCQPRPLNVMIVLGIAEGFHHPLLTERGFYTVGDGRHRLFTMPYAGDRYSEKRRIMWQLSYRYDDNDDDAGGSKLRDPNLLLQTVLEKCATWHEPVPSLIRSTPLETVWGTPLMDRDPGALQQAFQKYRRIVLAGDSLHSMSPFKGQGANQALLDGPLIAAWLQRSRVEAAVRGIWREAVARTDKVVQSSREAAMFWHSAACIPNNSADQEELCHFAGVRDDACRELLNTLSTRKITAKLAGELDETIRGVIGELGVEKVEDSVEDDDPEYFADILDFASRGDTAGLRTLSLTRANAIRSARDALGRSALYLASASGHFHTCRWLLTEAFVDPWVVDMEGRSPLDEAPDPFIRSLFMQKPIQS